MRPMQEQMEENFAQKVHRNIPPELHMEHIEVVVDEGQHFGNSK